MQLSFGDAGDLGGRKRTRREVVLAEREQVVPWQALLALIEPHYPKFDAGNRLRSAAGQGYRYDAWGRRVRSDAGGAQRRYSLYAQGGRLLWQRDEVAGMRINNAYFAGSLLAEVTRPLASDIVTLTYFHTDALGSPIARSSSAGSVIETSEYEPYGKLLNRSNDDRAGYTGHVMDSASGLTYMQQRYYDPTVGRFLSVDPVTASTVNGSNFNRYWYANNNPYRFTDPDGRATIYRYGDKIVVVQTYQNNGTQFTDEQIKAQGASLSGQTSDGKTVVVQFVPGNDKDAVRINPNPKLDDTSLDGTKRSHADKIGGRVVEIAPNAAGEGTVGHELGHTLHAGDQYKGGIGADGKKLQSDVAGPANIMKTATGTANTQTVDEIYKGASSKDNTQVDCTKGAKAGC